MTESKLVGWLADPTVSTMGAAESILPIMSILPSLLARLAFCPLVIGLVGREEIEKKPWSPSPCGSNGRLMLSQAADLRNG